MAFVIDTPSAADAERLAALKTDTFIDSYAAGSDPVQLAAHIQRWLSVEAVAAQLAFMFGAEAQTDLLMRLDLD